MVLMFRPHIVCLVEVGKHTPGLAGYNIIQSENKHCAGTIIYIRKDLIITKHEEGENFCAALIRPNKESLVCCIAVYISPNDRAKYKLTLDKINTLVQGILMAYKNITIVIFGDFNRKLKDQIEGFQKFTASWTYKVEMNE